MRVARSGKTFRFSTTLGRGAMMHNEKIRVEAKRRKVTLWRIAEALGIQDSSFSRMLRHELPEAKRAQILEIIDQLAEENGDEE